MLVVYFIPADPPRCLSAPLLQPKTQGSAQRVLSGILFLHYRLWFSLCCQNSFSLKVPTFLCTQQKIFEAMIQTLEILLKC